jgi:hypothetical protein
VVVPARPGEHPAAARVDPLRHAGELATRGGREGLALGLLRRRRRIDDEARGSGVALGQEGLVGAAADEQARVRVRDHVGLVHHVVATALVVALHDRRARAHLRPDLDRREELPVLSGVEVPEELLQVPLEHEAVALGVVEERRRDLAVELAPIVERIGVEGGELGSDRVGARAAVTPDAGRLTLEVHGTLRTNLVAAPVIAATPTFSARSVRVVLGLLIAAVHPREPAAVPG